MNILPLLKDIYILSICLSFVFIITIYYFQPEYVDNGTLGYKITYWVIFPFTPVINTLIVIYLICGTFIFIKNK